MCQPAAGVGLAIQYIGPATRRACCFAAAVLPCCVELALLQRSKPDPLLPPSFPPRCRFCFTWACCPLPEATCCNDHQHCCPNSLPVCDTTGGRCLAQAGVIEGSVPLYEKQPAQKKEGGGWFPFGQRGRVTV
jgi:hypothetical protein